MNFNQNLSNDLRIIIDKVEDLLDRISIDERRIEVKALGNPIQVPVGEEVLGRIFNVIGDVIDQGEPVSGKTKWSIHREPPKFEEQSTKSEIFETGIKVVDLLAPYAKGGKVVYEYVALNLPPFGLFIIIRSGYVSIPLSTILLPLI